jgi:hypothetical protein
VERAPPAGVLPQRRAFHTAVHGRAAGRLIKS